MSEVTFNCGSTISTTCEGVDLVITGSNAAINDQFLDLATEVIDIFMVL